MKSAGSVALAVTVGLFWGCADAEIQPQELGVIRTGSLALCGALLGDDFDDERCADQLMLDCQAEAIVACADAADAEVRREACFDLAGCLEANTPPPNNADCPSILDILVSRDGENSSGCVWNEHETDKWRI